ncbi:hypothetical protein NE237_029578 [Protea cynaroides]|uniref:Uncharacterized protein n=1 Tax=Protea cynaroides TaxID=273540 RepID=A0A9Q0GRF1_9MAGN|nr:hypothetical protein NE237_029578 [Protea cynaroides]
MMGFVEVRNIRFLERLTRSLSLLSLAPQRPHLISPPVIELSHRRSHRRGELVSILLDFQNLGAKSLDFKKKGGVFHLHLGHLGLVVELKDHLVHLFLGLPQDRQVRLRTSFFGDGIVALLPLCGQLDVQAALLQGKESNITMPPKATLKACSCLLGRPEQREECLRPLQKSGVKEECPSQGHPSRKAPRQPRISPLALD